MKKPLLVAFLIAAVVGGLALTGAVPLGAAQNSSEVAGSISSDATWTKANSPYVLTGPLFVDAQVSLVIEPGATVNFNSHIIQVNGVLWARGTSADPIHFNGGKTLFTVSSGGWNEQTETGSIIEYVVFTSSKIEIQDASPKISHNAFSRGSILVAGSNPHISGGSPVISNNNIVGITGIGSGITITGNNNATVSGNVIAGWGNGVVAGNLFYATSSFPLIERNLITNNSCAVKIDLLMRDWVGNNFPVIRENTISKNSQGICVVCNWQRDGNPDEFLIPTVISNNNIQDNGGSNLIGACIVDAIYNWWGTTHASSIAQTVSANYRFTPFLTAANARAPSQQYNPNPTLTAALALSGTPTPAQTSAPTPSQPSNLFSPSQSVIPQQDGGQPTQKGGFPVGTVVAVGVAVAAVVSVAVMLRKLFPKKL